MPKRSIGDRDELRHFKGKKWQEVTIEALKWNDGLLYFNNEGLQYYLPAYLTLILRFPDEIGNRITSDVIRDLGSPETIGDMCNLFSNKQRQAILEFLLSQSYEEVYRSVVDPDKYSLHQNQLHQKAVSEYNALRQRAIDYWQNC